MQIFNFVLMNGQIKWLGYAHSFEAMRSLSRLICTVALIFRPLLVCALDLYMYYVHMVNEHLVCVFLYTSSLSVKSHAIESGWWVLGYDVCHSFDASHVFSLNLKGQNGKGRLENSMLWLVIKGEFIISMITRYTFCTLWLWCGFCGGFHRHVSIQLAVNWSSDAVMSVFPKASESEIWVPIKSLVRNSFNNLKRSKGEQSRTKRRSNMRSKFSESSSSMDSGSISDLASQDSTGIANNTSTSTIVNSSFEAAATAATATATESQELPSMHGNSLPDTPHETTEDHA